MAKKPKGFSELLKQQQVDRTQEKALKKLQKKIQQDPWSDQVRGVVTDPQGEVKMSEVLEAFVEPYLDATRNRSQREKLFGTAVIAWNLAIMPENERQSMIEKFVKQCLKREDLLAQQEVREIIDEMIARKQEFFANNQRYIVDFQLQDLGHTFHLAVASVLTNPLDAKH